MTFIYLLLIAAAVFFVTIALVVIGQEVSILLAIALFCAVAYGAFKLATGKLTKL